MFLPTASEVLSDHVSQGEQSREKTEVNAPPRLLTCHFTNESGRDGKQCDSAITTIRAHLRTQA
jgi:hypothetical protein